MSVESEIITLKFLKLQQVVSRYFIYLSSFLSVSLSVLMIVQAYLIAITLDQVIMKHSQTHLVQHLTLLVAIVAARSLLNYLREIFSFRAGATVRHHIRKSIINKLHRLGPVYVKNKPVGEWNSMLVEQTEQLQEYYSRYLPQQILIAFVPLIILIAVFPQSWIAGLTLLLTAPLIPLFMILVGKGAAKASREHTSALQKLSSYFVDRLAGIATLKLFYRYQAEQQAVTRASEDYQARTMSVLKLAFLNSAVLEFFAAISIALLAVYLGFSFLEYLNVGFYGVKVTLFSAMFILILAPEFYQPLRDLGSFYHAKAQAIAAAEDIMVFLNENEEPIAKRKVQHDISDTATLTIVAKNFSVLSHDQKKLLQPMSFCWRSGDKIALVGKSGSGKSSLINALLGFLPYQGSLLINGIELRELSQETWHKQLSWLGQSPQLITGSIADNLRLADREASEEKMLKVLERVKLSEWIEQTANGLKAEIKEGNIGVSVGQAQRIALARLLLRPSSICIADEPTASLDKDSQHAVWHALFEHANNSGFILATHSIEQLMHMDTIWVLENGQLVQQDGYQSLMQTKGAFQTMLESQQESNG